MEILREIEDELEAINQPKGACVIEVLTDFDTHSLIELHQGLDFLMGTSEQGVVIIPIASVREMFGFDPSSRSESLLADLLAAQKTPVRIHYRIFNQRCAAWLLSTSSPWLRLAHPQGVVSVPMANLDFAQINPAAAKSGKP